MRTRSIGLVASVTIAVAMTATNAWAQPYFARGDFNGWDISAPLIDMGGGDFVATITGQTPGDKPFYKIAVEDWSSAWPGGNGRVVVDAAGEITFHFHPGPNADGWQPPADRVGYDDPGHGWDIMGSFNGWTGPVVVLADMGNGRYSGQTTVATPGTYEFKFRKAGDWDINTGPDFQFNGPNISVTTTAANESLQFDLDLPGGRWLVGAPPPLSAPAVSARGMSVLILAFAVGLIVWVRGHRGTALS